MRKGASVGTRRRHWLESYRSRAVNDPPTRGGLVLTYFVTLAVLSAGVFGSGFLIGFSAWAASGCLPSGHPFASSGSVITGILVMGGVLVAYCLGCAAYLWSVGAAAVHAWIWLGLGVLTVGVAAWALATVSVQPCN
jgi:hypothetical protein